MLTFIFFFQNSSGCLTWPYCTEVAVDVVLGFVGFMGYFVVFILTLTTQFMMDSALQPYGTFWMFGIIALISTVWHAIYIKETKYLNDKEKKNLYSQLKSAVVLDSEQSASTIDGLKMN